MYGDKMENTRPGKWSLICHTSCTKCMLLPFTHAISILMHHSHSHMPFPFPHAVPPLNNDVQDPTLCYGGMYTLALANARTSNNGGACTKCMLLPFTHTVSVLPCCSCSHMPFPMSNNVWDFTLHYRSVYNRALEYARTSNNGGPALCVLPPFTSVPVLTHCPCTLKLFPSPH
jgi:hypothetical protein